MTSTSDIDGSFLLEVSDRPPDDWAGLVARNSQAEYSQTLHWAESVGRHVPDADIIWLTVRRSGELVAGLNTVARRTSRKALGFSLRLDHWDCHFEGTSGGPVIADDLDPAGQDLVFGMLVDELARMREGNLGSCSLVLSPDQEKRFGPLMRVRSRWTRQDVLTAAVSLQGGLEEVEKNRLVTNKRNERNRGLRRGVDFLTTTDEDLLEEYYRIYERAAAHWGVPPNPLPLLKNLLADPDSGVFFTCVRLEGKVIGGHVNLHHGGRVLVWNGVTDPAFARKYFPATICIWGDLVEACRRGAAWLDLGGSGQIHSLSGFKKFFGAELQMRGLYFHDAPLLGLLKRGRDVWRGLGKPSAQERWHDRDVSPTEGGGREAR